LVKLVHEYGFCTGANVPASQVNGPFSVKKPERLEQPGPPFSLDMLVALERVM
jgi:hypothetical protein